MSGYGELLHAPAAIGLLCFGPPEGANVTFVRADQWIQGWRDEDPARARAEVLRRYLRAYGPATAPDFARWSGFGTDATRSLFQSLSDELEHVRVDRKRGWILAGDADGSDERTGVWLLPRYDPYILGFRPRDPLVPPPVKERIRQDPKGRFETVTGVAPVVVDGVVTGLWRKRKERSGHRIEVEHVLPLPKGRRSDLDAALEQVQRAGT